VGFIPPGATPWLKDFIGDSSSLNCSILYG